MRSEEVGAQERWRRPRCPACLAPQWMRGVACTCAQLEEIVGPPDILHTLTPGEIEWLELFPELDQRGRRAFIRDRRGLPPAPEEPNVPPDGPGVYVVQMLNETPISVNADRAKIAGRCIQVTREHVKFGRAKSLLRRQSDYVRTFGEGNFRFVFWIETELYCELEAAVAKRLHRHRIAGLTGRMNEWLAGISVDEVIAVVKQESARLPLFSKAVEDLMKIPVVLSSRSKRNTPAHAGTLFAADVVEAAIYLREHGMDQRLLAKMHHPQRQPETYASTIRYFGLHTELRGKNVSYAARLAFVAKSHQKALARHGLAFEELVEQALQAFPVQ